MHFDPQQTYDIRAEWGEHAISEVAPGSAVVVIVDVITFSSCADAACSRGASLLPFAYGDPGAKAFALTQRAVLATKRQDRQPGQPYQSPLGMLGLGCGDRVVLPSLNGAQLTLAARELDDEPLILAGCLRNAAAVAAHARRHQQQHGGAITLVAGGERWPGDDVLLRPAVEDALGVGALVDALIALGARNPSPEARFMQQGFRALKGQLHDMLLQSASGEELRMQGFEADVAACAEFNVSACVPVLDDCAFVAAD